MTPIPRLRGLNLHLLAMCNGQPRRDLFVVCRLPMLAKNSHAVVFGPAAASGVVDLTPEVIRRSVRRDVSSFPMDYSPFESNWTGHLVVAPVGPTELHRFQAAYALYSEYLEYPPDWSVTLGRIAHGLSGCQLGDRLSLRTMRGSRLPPGTVLQLSSQIIAS